MDVSAIEEFSLADQDEKRHTSAPAGMSEKENRHGPAPLLQRAEHECFESWTSKRYAVKPSTKLCHGTDSCCTDALLRRRWAVTPKLTMIAGQQLSIGAASGAKPPSRFHDTRQNLKCKSIKAVSI